MRTHYDIDIEARRRVVIDVEQNTKTGNGPIQVICACPDEVVAQKIADALVEGQLAACAQTFPIRSTYRWRGVIEHESEVMLVAKTRGGLFPAIEARVKEIHPYEVAEIIAVPIVASSADYLAWIDEETV